VAIPSLLPKGDYAVAVANAVHWHPGAAYLYVLHLDGAALAWEYLRRNPDYRRVWQRHRRHPQRPYYGASPWGLRLLEDPARDAREAQPDWFPDTRAVVLLFPDDDPTVNTQPFHLWDWPGRKQVTHDGQRLVVAIDLVGHMLHLAVSPALHDGMAYAYAVRAGGQLCARWRALEAELALLDDPNASCRAVSGSRPTRTALQHMHTLQALDGRLCGASYRQIAEVVWGHSTVARDWHADGDLRARVRRLVRRGQALTDGGYRALLQP
jgi:hypothetical protein